MMLPPLLALLAVPLLLAAARVRRARAERATRRDLSEYRSWCAFRDAMAAAASELLDVPRAAAMVGRCPQTIYRWVARGRLAPDPGARVMMFRAEAVMAAQHRRVAGRPRSVRG